MTDLGAFLLMAATICGMLGLIKALAWLSDALERRRQGLPVVDWRPRSVNSGVVPAPTPRPVPADTYQAEPPSVPPAPAGTEPVRNQRIRTIAGWRDELGGWAYSANKIAALVGGQRDEVLALVREVRGESEPQEEYDPARHLMVDGRRVIAR